MEHEIIFDLLPLYHDGVCSDASRRAVEEHLKTCPACRAALAAMDAPLPEAGKAAPDDAAAVRSLFPGLGEGQTPGLVEGGHPGGGGVRGAGGGLGGGYPALPVSGGPGEDPDHRCAAAIGRADFCTISISMTTGTCGRSGLNMTTPGTSITCPSGALITGKRPDPSLADSERCLDVAEELAWAEDQGIHREITHVWYGQGEDAILLWEEGMDLPAASAADEAAWGYEPGSADYWAERTGESAVP